MSVSSKIYLVTLCHTMDDFPIKLFSSREDAIEFLDANPFIELESGTRWTSSHEVMAAYEIAGIDASTPVCYKIWEFEDGTLRSVT